MSRYATSEMEENIFSYVENQSLEIQMYTYFIVAKRYMFCR